ncbi:astacin-like metalloprotease toxin 5 [Panonychus citri]|uniref:astacin-like metalloprotease toxin 5 n=1 Tax=Panonychus citri TaxID=50023 RepID=UPI0023076FE2|nr:astacin-like metalloprotease toxin 5 [Panonychus citri]XP_053211280.1 astacin-like metalloprotease toxin 5 [Panonychus citri]XP_053214087.1 astacin-like metalloprotease toxin 5 [Panonychus citri]
MINLPLITFIFLIISTSTINSLPVINEIDNEFNDDQLITEVITSQQSIKPLEDLSLFLGDIKLRAKNESTNNDDDKMLFRNAIEFDDNLWSYAYVPIEIDPKLDKISSMIEEALDEFHQKTCIRFKTRIAERDYVKFIFDEGCYSFVGRLGGLQTISLGDGCHCKGTIIHETMHALGFYHEHNRSDRDDYVTINYDNIQSGAKNMFIKLNPHENRLYTTYDYESIMHYDGAAFSKSANLLTMVPKQEGVNLVHPCDKPFLSVKDVEKLNQLYKCSN